MLSITASPWPKLLVLAIGSLLVVGLVQGDPTGSNQLDPARILLGSPPDSSAVEAAPRFQADVASTVQRQIRGLLAGDGDANGRHLQDEWTFEGACNFIAGMVYEESDGGIACTCTTSTLTIRCETPNPVCDEVLWSGVCASFSMEIAFTQDLVPTSSETCVDFSGSIDPSGPFRDGCVSASYGANGTTVESCAAAFDDANGVPTNCTSCRGCTGGDVATSRHDGGGEGDEDVGFSLDCSNIYPGAVTDGCYVSAASSTGEEMGMTAEEASALFPAVETSSSTGGGNGATTGAGGGGGGASAGTSGAVARTLTASAMASASALVWHLV
jgi:hypothetical protein